jgi:hypothetical protein
LKRLRKSLTTSGMYENAGVKEYQDFEDYLLSLDTDKLSYNARTTEARTFFNAVDATVMLFCK